MTWIRTTFVVGLLAASACDAGDDGATSGGSTSGTVDTGESDPGSLGGVCASPAGMCEQGVCNTDENYCYDPDAPCAGFDCGGEDRGTCTPLDGEPACVCNPGFENETFSLYCCPEDGSDALCI